MTAPFAYLIYFFQRERSRLHRLITEYKHKAIMANALQAYIKTLKEQAFLYNETELKETLEENDSKYKDFIFSTITNIFKSPVASAFGEDKNLITTDILDDAKLINAVKDSIKQNTNKP